MPKKLFIKSVFYYKNFDEYNFVGVKYSRFLIIWYILKIVLFAKSGAYQNNYVEVSLVRVWYNICQMADFPKNNSLNFSHRINFLRRNVFVNLSDENSWKSVRFFCKRILRHFCFLLHQFCLKPIFEKISVKKAKNWCKKGRPL